MYSVISFVYVPQALLLFSYLYAYICIYYSYIGGAYVVHPASRLEPIREEETTTGTDITTDTSTTQQQWYSSESLPLGWVALKPGQTEVEEEEVEINTTSV